MRDKAGSVKTDYLIRSVGPGGTHNGYDGLTYVIPTPSIWYEISSLNRKIRRKHFEIDEFRLKQMLNIKSLCRPPEYRKEGPSSYAKLPMKLFPIWWLCPNNQCNSLYKSTEFANNRNCKNDHKKPKLVNQVPFITVCEDGHLGEFPWRLYVCETNDCDGQLILTNTQNTFSLRSNRASCKSCNKSKSLKSETNISCNSESAWLPKENLNETCMKNLFLLNISASSVYIPHIVSSVSIPPEGNWETFLEYIDTTIGSKRFADQYNTLANLSADSKLITKELIKSFDIDTTFSLELYEKYFEYIKDPLNQGFQSEKINYSNIYSKEFQALNESKDSINFRNEIQNINEFDSLTKKLFSSVNLIHRLKTTDVLYGFSRLNYETDQNPYDTEFIEKKISQMFGKEFKEVDFLPALENYGEGIFLIINNDFYKNWKNSKNVINRIDKLLSNIPSAKNPEMNNEDFLELYTIHSLSHSLINELSKTCGYSSASIQERLYYRRSKEINNMYGILLYTANPASDGTLGGLVSNGLPGTFDFLINNTINSLSYCSFDPVCYQRIGEGIEIQRSYESSNVKTNGAACHHCLFISETSCEMQNKYLDRALITSILNKDQLGFIDYIKNL